MTHSAYHVPGSISPALLVVSHLRWHFVFQRPQHLMTRAARTRPVYYIEEPVFGDWNDHLITQPDESGVVVCTPHIQIGHSASESQARTAALIQDLVVREGLDTYDLWVYAPMELPVTAGLSPRVTVYDCMDELANFKDAPPELRAREAELLARAEVVFTGGHRLYEAKAALHQNAHPFPSSVDTAHFAQARQPQSEPDDLHGIPHPRLGFAGVIDERFDTALLAEVARRQPDWHFVLLGPVVKIDPADLPQGPNLHYLGMKPYAQLPAYFAHWDVGLLPFAHNAATEFISPTKTPEYLAAGLSVVSTGIRDVVRPYGEQNMVRIADGADAFEAACAAALAEVGTGEAHARLRRADTYLGTLSWDRTWFDMDALMTRAADPALEPMAADD